MSPVFTSLAVAILIGASQAPPSQPAEPARPPASERDAAAGDAVIAERMMAELQPVSAGRVTLWAPPEALPVDEARAFAAELEKGLNAIERLTGEQVDAGQYGSSNVQVFVSRQVTISHVYGGYAHPQHRKAYLFLNPQRVKSRTAPYLHELTHIVLWRFGSHSLREGFASYVEGRLADERIGYNSGVFGPGPRAEVDAAAAAALAGSTGAIVLPWIGRSGATDPAITSAANADSRAAFYLLSRSFVQHLLDSIDVPTFIKLYRAKNTEAAFLDLTGLSLDQWRESWKRSLAQA